MTAESPPMLVAVVDDNALMRETLADMLEACGCETATFEDAPSLRQALDDGRWFSLVITDEWMSTELGSELLADLRHRHPTLPLVLLTGDLTRFTSLPSDDLYTRKVYKPVGLAQLKQLAEWAASLS